MVKNMDFWNLLQIYTWKNGGWIMLYSISFLIMIYYISKNKQKSWMISIPIIVAVITFNPIFAKLTNIKIFPSYKEYSRMTWMLFIPIIISAVITEISIKENNKKILIFFAVILLLIDPTWSIPKLVVEPQNTSKIYDYILDINKSLVNDVDKNSNYSISEISREDLLNNDPRPYVLVQSDSAVGHAGDPVFFGIRQYTSKVKVRQVLIPPDVYNSEDFNLAVYNLMSHQYFVCVNSPVLRQQAEQYGFELIEETEEYLLLKNKKSFSIYFVRHGQTNANLEEILAGSGTDAMLNDEGELQASNAGNALKDVQISQVYTSESSRTQDTANIILNNNYSSYDIEINKISLLNDLNWGTLEGKSISEVFNTYPDFNEDTYLGTINDSTFVSNIGAETKNNVVNRINNGLCNVVAPKALNDTNILIVGHSSMQWWMQYITKDNSIEGLDNASISLIEYNQGKWNIKYINEQAENFKVKND